MMQRESNLYAALQEIGMATGKLTSGPNSPSTAQPSREMRRKPWAAPKIILSQARRAANDPVPGPEPDTESNYNS
jgi:hypothetical protein